MIANPDWFSETRAATTQLIIYKQYERWYWPPFRHAFCPAADHYISE